MTGGRAARALVLLAAALGTEACATAGRTPRAWRDPAVLALDGRTGAPLDRGAVAAALGGARVVYVGELHGSPPHQAAQLEVLRLLEAGGARLAVAVEWLPADAQPALDRYLAGETDEAGLQEEAGWREAWGHTFEAYAPILRWARERSVPVWALNAPNRLARAVARGEEAALPPEDRARLPPLDDADPAHRAWFEGEMRGLADAHHPLDDATLGRFFRAQVLRDAAMARALEGHLRRDPRVAVVLAGTGHVVHAHGIPRRVDPGLGAPFAVVVPADPRRPRDARAQVGAGPWPERAADLLWLVR